MSNNCQIAILRSKICNGLESKLRNNFIRFVSINQIIFLRPIFIPSYTHGMVNFYSIYSNLNTSQKEGHVCRIVIAFRNILFWINIHLLNYYNNIAESSILHLYTSYLFFLCANVYPNSAKARVLPPEFNLNIYPVSNNRRSVSAIYCRIINQC